MKHAIIDLGSNTFHLLIVDHTADATLTLFKDQIPAKIAKSGINQGIITPEATERALGVLRIFKEKIVEFGVEMAHVKAIGTSAIRSAANGQAFCETIENETGIRVEVISGAREAELIYEGVRQAMDLGEAPSVVMDIGGGSVEFIICNNARIFWKQSFEIGGQRLLERFVQTDPISPAAIRRLHDYFQEQLLPLVNAAHQYAPKTLVGSSGSFDTLIDMDFMHRLEEWPDAQQKNFDYTLPEFYRAYDLITTRSRAERMAIPGMIELRVDMIVPAMVLIQHVIQSLGITTIRCSTYALKEGILAWVLERNEKI
jgi:exopolyphosphatase / guanosine-5'-triphosphate,3'-diphosphate pyrophosphatase